MPPLKGIDRALNGNALKVLEEMGHGQQIVIVDPSYEIPADPERLIVDYQGNSSAGALRGIVQLVPIEKMDGKVDVVVMKPDPPAETSKATKAFEAVAQDLDLVLAHQIRTDDSIFDKGFYSLANDPEKSTVYFRTRDAKAYACALFVVGHSQE